MKAAFIAIAAVLAVAMCVSNQPAVPNTETPTPTVPPVVSAPETNYCGLTVVLLNPSPEEQVSGGFRAEWSVRNDGNEEITNSQFNFTISMGDKELRKVTRFNTASYKEDLTFLSPVAKGYYNVTVSGTKGDCVLHPAIVEIKV